MKKTILLFAAIMMAAVTFAQTPTVSASSVTFRFCETTTETISELVFPSEFPFTVTFSDGSQKTYQDFGTYIETTTNDRGCDNIVTVQLKQRKYVAPGLFSVAADKKVCFAKGNLQYCASPNGENITHATKDGTANGIWRMAENATDYVGGHSSMSYVLNGNVFEGGKQCSNNDRSANYTGWIDLFCYGCSGKNTSYQPYSTSVYSPYKNQKNEYDFGWYNAISNAGNQPGHWYMLTEKEWGYLLGSRKYNTTNGTISITNSGSNPYFQATIDGVNGCIIMADGFVKPQDITINISSTNTYTASQWEAIEKAGAIFLPKAGSYNNSSQYTSDKCYYLLHTDASTQGNVRYRWEVNNSNATNTSDATAEAVRLVIDPNDEILK